MWVIFYFAAFLYCQCKCLGYVIVSFFNVHKNMGWVLLILKIITPFFEVLSADCPKDDYVLISWQWTPDKKDAPRNDDGKILLITSHYLLILDMRMTVLRYGWYLNQFGFKKISNENKKQLKWISIDADRLIYWKILLHPIIKINHHQNELQHFMSVISELNSLFQGVYHGSDYSEYLNISMKQTT